MNALDLAKLTAEPIGKLGSSFYFDPGTAQAAGELGLNVFEFYGLGRGGTMGDVDVSVVEEAFTFFHPRVYPMLWTAAKEKGDPDHVAARYIDAAYAYADRTFGAIELDVMRGFAAATHDVAVAVATGNHLLFDGYRRYAVSADPVHAAYHGVILLRELRGGAHIDAVHDVGLSPLEACYIDNAAIFKLHGYQDDEVPDITSDHEAMKARAEEITNATMASYFSVIDDAARDAIAAGTLAMNEALEHPVERS